MKLSLEEAVNILLSEIQKLDNFSNQRFILAIDGQAGAGKTTLASALSKKLGWPIVHADHYFLPMEKRNSSYFQKTKANLDLERLKQEVILPFQHKGCLYTSKLNCHTMSYQKNTPILANQSLIVEGTYCTHPYLEKYWSYSIFIHSDLQTRLKRIQNRSFHNNVEKFINKWIPLEDTYFNYFKIQEQANLSIELI